MDLALGNWGSTTSTAADRVLLNDGRGYFTDGNVVLPDRLLDSGWLTTDVQSGDLDGDGRQDLIMSVWNPEYSDTRLQVFLNSGNGSFSDASDTVEGNGSTQVHNGWTRIVDLNDDGRLDIFSSTSIFLNFTGTFQRLAAPNWLSSTYGDFNADGQPDLVTALNELQIVYHAGLKGNIPLWSTTGQNAFVTGGDAATVALVLDGDGKLDDLFIAQYLPFGSSSSSVRLFKTSNGSLVESATGGASSFFHPINTVRVGDFTGDGLSDVFIGDAGKDSDPFPGGQNGIFIQAGGALMDETAARVPTSSDYTHGLAVGDIDGDGDLDVYLSNITSLESKAPGFLINDGSGKFTFEN